MNNKRTPQSRSHSNSSIHRFSSNLNSTTVGGGGGSATKIVRSRPGSASKPLRVQPNLDITCGASGYPTIKSNLTIIGSPVVDCELECEFVHNEYLQALKKREIVKNIIEKHEQDLQDQLSIQKDNLHRSRMAFKRKQQEIQDLAMLNEVNELLQILDGSLNTFLQLSVDNNLNDILKQLLLILNTICNKVHVKNIKPINNQEGFDKFVILLEKCMKTLKTINSSSRLLKEVNQLANLMKKFQELSHFVSEKQSLFNNLQKNETYKFLKTFSDMYAEKEKYEENIL